MATLHKCTLLDLVQTVSDCATSDAEIVATVAYLINSGKVLLCGTFAGARIDLSAPSGAVPRSASRLIDSLQKTVLLERRERKMT